MGIFVKGFPQDFKILFRVANTHANVDLNAAAPLSLISEWVIRARAVSRLQCRRSATGHAPATPAKRSAAPRLGERYSSDGSLLRWPTGLEQIMDGWWGHSNPNVEAKQEAPFSGQGARSGTNFTRSSEPASWIA